MKKQLNEWQQRVVVEKMDLDRRIEALQKFMGSENFKRTDEEQRSLLAKQLIQMKLYSRTLAQRLAIFRR